MAAHLDLPWNHPRSEFGKYRLFSITVEPMGTGPGANRLYMASSHSLYALYVEARGAV